MPYKNLKDLLIDATRFPAAIEIGLPGAPKLSATLASTLAGLPAVPDLPLAIPDLPAAPAIPTAALPAIPQVFPFIKGLEAAPEKPPAPAPVRARRLVFE